MAIDKSTLQDYIGDPSGHFATPDDVLQDTRMSDSEKRKVLESWRVDETEKSTAVAENMGEKDRNLLPQVLAALRALDNRN